MEIYHLTNETIDTVSDRIGHFYADNGRSKKDTLRAKLLLEEALIKYQHRFGEDTELYFREYRILKQLRFFVRLRAPGFDPFSLEENPMGFMLQSIMSSFEGTLPAWHYRNMENELVFSFRKKEKFDGYFWVGIALLAATVLGLLSRLLFAPDKLAAFSGSYIEPLADAYAGAFCVMAVLMTLFAIALGIVDIGDISSAGKAGGRIFRCFLTATVITVCAFTLPILPFFNLSRAGTFTIASKTLYDVLIGFIPTNLITPFLNFDSIHIMLIGAMFGFSCLALGTKTEALVELFRECNLVAIHTNNFLNRFIFVYVALKVYSFITLNEFSAFSGTALMVGYILLADLLIMAAFAFFACRVEGCTLKFLLSTLMPSFMIALSSANFGAAFISFFDAMAKMKADGRIYSIALNMGGVVFQPACTVSFVVSTLFMANNFGIDISPWWFIISLLLSVALVIAMPNIPGAAVSAYTLLYAQLGLPAAALSLMIALNALLQFLTCAVDVWCLLCETICLSHNKAPAD